MSNSLAQSIQRERYMDLKGHKTMVVECRDIKADRVLCAKLSKAKSVTKAPEVITNLYKLLGE